MVKEYIERDRAVSELVHDYAYAAAKIVEAIPAADVVEVVRCKDCKHKIEEPLGVWCDVWCMHIMVGGNGFCCYGENRGA